jgi:hypothetical protein
MISKTSASDRGRCVTTGIPCALHGAGDLLEGVDRLLGGRIERLGDRWIWPIDAPLLASFDAMRERVEAGA